MMKKITDLIYVSCILPVEREKEMIQASPNSVSIQAYKYHRLLAEGFARNGVNVTVLTYQKYLSSIGIHNGYTDRINNVEYNYIVPSMSGKLSYLDLFLKVYNAVKNLCRKKKNVAVICDILNLTIAYAACVAAKHLGIQVVGIVTDFPSMSKKSFNSKMMWRLISKCDKWVLLTEQMYDYLGRKKPAVIMEGHADENMSMLTNLIENKDNPRRCIYAGGLKKIHGIEKLVKAFQEANVENAELHVYGNGEYAFDLQNLKDPRIIYHGVVPNGEVVVRELTATLLINPRPSTEEFTKYSFPSKNMEYMASGTAVLTTKLPGMPKEYYKYVYLFEDESIEGMAKTIKKVLSLTNQELFDKGKKAREYVLTEKSNVRQASRIIELIQQ
jgi:glycosyltransferase involved in cell wall biosynthesis